MRIEEPPYTRAREEIGTNTFRPPHPAVVAARAERKRAKARKPEIAAKEAARLRKCRVNFEMGKVG